MFNIFFIQLGEITEDVKADSTEDVKAESQDGPTEVAGIAIKYVISSHGPWPMWAYVMALRRLACSVNFSVVTL